MGVTAQDQQSRELWIDPNDKSRAQYLPHIGEAVLFKHAGRVYTGKHTGGSFKADYPLGKSFTTWDCVWMYPAALDTAAQVLAMGRGPACPYPCGWDGLHKIAVADGAYLAHIEWPEDEEGVSVQRAVAMRTVTNLIDVCRAMLAANQKAPTS